MLVAYNLGMLLYIRCQYGTQNSPLVLRIALDCAKLRDTGLRRSAQHVCILGEQGCRRTPCKPQRCSAPLSGTLAAAQL